MKTVVSGKGQVSVPKLLRERKGPLIAEKLPLQDTVSSVYGILKLGRGTDRAMKERRGGSAPR